MNYRYTKNKTYMVHIDQKPTFTILVIWMMTGGSLANKHGNAKIT